MADRMPKPNASPKTLAARLHPVPNNVQREAMTTYANAVQEMQSGNFREALAGFHSLDGNTPPEVRERARVYEQACERQLKRYESQLEFHTPVEQYDYAIACVNNSDLEEARDHLQAVIEFDDTLDYAHYGMAVLLGMTGQADGCLHHLERAILLNPFNRTQARSDADFRPMADDPRFTELLYPEAM